MIQYPAIGLDSAQAHLHDVLLPAYERFTESETLEKMRQFAEAAWNIPERHWHDKGCVPPGKRGKQQFTEELFKACRELRWMRDIAETGKHTGLGRPDVEVARITGEENPGGTLEISEGIREVNGQLMATPRHATKRACTLKIETVVSCA
jgi:hypothetical protein